jgi:tellurite resistance-related uncharacterized protein
VFDNFGNSFRGAKSVSVKLTQLDGSDSKDITKSSVFNKDNNSGTITLNENEVGKYRFVVTVDNYPISTLVTVTDKLRVQSVAYQVSQSRKFPVELTDSVLHPNKIDNIKAATDDHYIHMQVSASFVKSSVKPS